MLTEGKEIQATLEEKHYLHSMVVNILTLGSGTPSRRPHIAKCSNSSKLHLLLGYQHQETGPSSGEKTSQSLKILKHFEVHNFTYKSREM